MPAALALLHGLLPEVRDLQELGALDVERLDKAASEVEHRVGRGEPLAHAGDLDHGLRDLHRVLEQLVVVLAQVGRHQVVQPLHVPPDQERVLADNRKRRLDRQRLVLDDLLPEVDHLRVVGRARQHAPALGRGRQELGAVLETRCFVDEAPAQVQRLQHHAVRCVVLGPLVVHDEDHRHHEEQEEEEEAEDHQLVVLLEEEARQADAHLRRRRTVGIAVLLVVRLGNRVGQRRVGLGDLDEARARQRVVRVLVGVVDEREFPVCLLDLLVVGGSADLEDVEGVELLDLSRCAGDLRHAVEEDDPEERQKAVPDQGAAALGGGLLLPGHPLLLHHLRAFAVGHGTARLARARHLRLRLRLPEEEVSDNRVGPRHEEHDDDGASEVVEGCVVVGQRLVLLVILGERVAEARHGRDRRLPSRLYLSWVDRIDDPQGAVAPPKGKRPTPH
mmetsp:Transcript_58999/g.173185  ORF Transcript_58999/g.173185 Transcript_58999/m.173185 type:complete len:447 (-) Transcript_58999:21-1361(-)